MKAVLFFCLLAVTGALSADSCYESVGMDCMEASNVLSLSSCNARYGDFSSGQNIVADELKAYANLHLERSYDYLLSSAYYSNYKTNRAGFSKLFRKLSDDAWEKTIDLIKHVTMRGDKMNFGQRTNQRTVERKNYTVELHELDALAKALDTQKELAERAFYIHREATRNAQNLHDPEIAQYLEEEFVEYQAKKIRDLAGHTNDLKGFVNVNNGQDLSLGLYLFDEYLQKVV